MNTSWLGNGTAQLCSLSKYDVSMVILFKVNTTNQGAVREYLWYLLSTKKSNSFIIVVGWWGLMV